MSARRAWTYAAGLFSVITLITGCTLPFLKWHPQASFDVLGVGWLLTNSPNLFLWVLCLFMAVLALYCWVRTALAEG